MQEFQDDQSIQIEIHGKWLRWLSFIVVTANGIGLPGLAWLVYSQTPLLDPVCVQLVQEAEAFGVRKLNEDCELAIRVVANRLTKYLELVEELRDELGTREDRTGGQRPSK